MSAGRCGPFGFIGGQTFRLYEGGRRGSKGGGGGHGSQGTCGVTRHVCGGGLRRGDRSDVAWILLWVIKHARPKLAVDLSEMEMLRQSGGPPHYCLGPK